MPTFSSISRISFWAIITSCLTSFRRSFLYFFSFIKESTHLVFVRFSGYNLRKSFLGILAFLTNCSWIILSLSRMLSNPCLAIAAISSNILGLNLRNWKISPNFSNSVIDSFELRPFLSITFWVLLNWRFKLVILLWTSFISGPEDTSSSDDSAASASSFALWLPGPAEGTSSISSKNPVKKSFIFFSPSFTSWK